MAVARIDQLAVLHAELVQVALPRLNLGAVRTRDREVVEPDAPLVEAVVGVVPPWAVRPITRPLSDRINARIQVGPSRSATFDMPSTRSYQSTLRGRSVTESVR